MRRIAFFILLINAIIIGFVTYLTKNKTHNSPLDLVRQEFENKHTPSVDHSKFAVLQQAFKSPQDVTAACLSCHTERGAEMLKTAHFQWEREEYIEGRGVMKTGKKNLINNFCVSIGSSEEMCNKCHAGYGYGHKDFDFTNEKNIDCLACHSTGGHYAKKDAGSGNPADTVNLNMAAMYVGLPEKMNCGACHFLGGGGNNVKHGDLEVALLSSGTDVDVHMGYDGLNMECVDCHTAENHVIKGKMYSVSSMNRNRASCTDCHTEHPHKDDIIDAHSLKVSCQACHIPTYAKVNATITHWDWSTAGKLKDGHAYTIDDEDGNHLYYSKKGNFTWGKNLEPEYVWFNGKADHYFLGDKINPDSVTKINTLLGDYNDPESKIVPVKVHYAKQPYDKVNKTLVAPGLYGEKGSGAFWADYNWDKAMARGMDYVEQPFSGEYGFADTKMYWPVNHMVSKAEDALSCTECHSRNGRLAELEGFYLPGRDHNLIIEKGGASLILLTFLGVLFHGLLRIFNSFKSKKD